MSRRARGLDRTVGSLVRNGAGRLRWYSTLWAAHIVWAVR